MIKILAISVIALGMASCAMAQQSAGNGTPAQSGTTVPSAAGHKDTTTKNGTITTTVDPGTTGSTANSDSGMPNANGASKGCAARPAIPPVPSLASRPATRRV